MHYLIDGYNLLFLLYKGEDIKLESQRNSIIKLLQQKSFSGEIILVFDGDQEEDSVYIEGDNFRIIYTAKNETADEYIIKRICYQKKKSHYVLVSSDKRLASIATYEGALHLSVEAFLKNVLLNSKSKSSHYKDNNKPIQDTAVNIARLKKLFEEKLETEERH